MSKNLDELLQEAPTLTFEPFPQEENKPEKTAVAVQEEKKEEILSLTASRKVKANMY